MDESSKDTIYARLAKGDLKTFRSLMILFGDAFGDASSYVGAPPSDRYVEELLDATHIILLAATYGDEVIGGLVAYEMKKFEQERTEIYIYDLAVSELYRRRGVATNLIKSLASIASRRGAYVLMVQADPPDEPAVTLYDKLGSREEVYHYDIPLPKDRNDR